MNTPQSLQLRDVAVIGSATGSWVHLVENRELHTSSDPHCLCGNKAAKPTQTWFALSGCRRCCKAGIKAGLVEIVDVDGAVVRLQDVLDGVLPDD